MVGVMEQCLILRGGCYAKCINLSKENEPLIWDAIKFGSILENVVINDQGVPDYSDSTYTEILEFAIQEVL